MRQGSRRGSSAAKDDLRRAVPPGAPIPAILECVPINEWSDSIQVVELQNDPSFADDMAVLANGYQRAADDLKAGRPGTRARDLVLDFRHVQFLNSSNIAQLLRVRKLAMLAGARIRVCSVSDRIWGVLLATDLDRIFDFSEDVTTSLTALQMSKHGA